MKKITPKQIQKIWEKMSPEQRADSARVTDNWMTREEYDRKWIGKQGKLQQQND